MKDGPRSGRARAMPRIGWRRAAALALSFAAGCSSAHYRESADKEVYGVLSEKQGAVLGGATPFTIDPPAGGVLQSLLGDGQKTAKLSLAATLAVSLEHSRQYQSQKESLYLAMLSLTGVRYRYAPNFFASLAGTLSGDKTATQGSANGSAGVNQLLKSGARTTLSIATTIFRSFTSNPRDAASSVLSLSFVQPLIRGAGARIAAEALTQGERDAIYAVRTFERYRQTFSVSIANQFYQVLANRNAVTNAENNLRSLRLNRERSEQMARAGRLPDFQVDQARSSEFEAEDSYVRAQRSYEDALDQFKLTLGIPTDSPIVLDEAELTKIGQAGLKIVEMDPDEAIRTALERRLDLANERDAVADAERRVGVARNDLLPSLDLSGRINIPTEEKEPGHFRLDHFTYEAGVDVELPLSRKNERNAYRSALISFEREKRNYREQEDSVKLAVVRAQRRLAQARRTHQIQELSLRLQERRVESTDILLRAGRAQTREYLDSQNALLNAQNDLTRALVDYTIARLEFFRDIGVLRIGESGMWIEEELPGRSDPRAAAGSLGMDTGEGHGETGA